MRKTKIICTIGPASENPEILSQIIEAGMNVSRHNFSHGDHEEHAARINLVKELAKKHNKEIAVMLDTKTSAATAIKIILNFFILICV